MGILGGTGTVLVVGEGSRGLTGLPGPPSDRLAPGAHPDAVQRLDPDFVFRPLLQVLDGKLSLLPVGDDVDQRPARRAHAGVLHPVAHLLGIPVVFPLGQRLVRNTERRPASAWERGRGRERGSTHHPPQPEAGLAGGAQRDVGGGHVGGGGKGLDLPGGLAGGAGAHDVHLLHAEPGRDAAQRG